MRLRLVKYWRKSIAISVIVIGLAASGWYFYTLRKEAELLNNYVDIADGRIDDSDSDLYPAKVWKDDFYYRGNKVSCWYLGEARDITNAIYYFVNPRGKIIKKQRPIIYVKPGDKIYSQFWEVFYVHVPYRYKPNAVKSIDTILRAEKDGVFKVTFPEYAVNMPIVAHDVDIIDGQADFPTKVLGYYYGKEVTFLRFEDNLKVYKNGRIDSMPVIVPYRVGDLGALFESIRYDDLNGDGDFADSYAIVDFIAGSLAYSPLHKLAYIYVNDNYPALTKSRDDTKVWKSFGQMTQNKGGYIDFTKKSQGLDDNTGVFFNCSQKIKK